MSKKNGFDKMSTKKKSRRLFLGMLFPLLILTIGACTFFYMITGQILDYYINAQLQGSVETLNSNVLEKMDPVIVNVENFANFGELTDDSQEILDTLVRTFAKNLEYASSFYYMTATPVSKGGFFAHSNGYVPPESVDMTKRDWFTSAVKAHGELCFSDPYVDSETSAMAVTISKAVKGKDGNIKGVVGSDILMDQLLAMLRKMSISKNSRMDLINQNGTYMTNIDASKVLRDKWIDDTRFKGDIKTWLNGEKKSEVKGNSFYAVCKVGKAPWYIVIEGPKVDFSGRLSNTILTFEILLIAFSIFASIMNIRTIKKMREGEQKLGADLFEETQNLVVSAKENAATSQDQSAAVKEIVATMEDSNALSESIASKIRDVSKVSEKTSADVATGVSSIEQNVAQLHAIFDANQQTIDGMKVLSERIESIWDIVTLINNVADQAKIIAFNAELEASSAGEAGKSFRIVANEIRRLSDGIIDGTKEIKEKINEIQHSSDSLILASESGTEKINAGYENAKGLAERFASIRDSAEITASSASDITEIIQQQTTSSEQILIALKQISAGVENFTVATDTISSSAEHIREMSEQLNNSVKSDGKK